MKVKLIKEIEKAIERLQKHKALMIFENEQNKEMELDVANAIIVEIVRNK